MRIARGIIVMHLFVTFALIIGPALLLTIGFLSVVRDLLSRSVFAVPSSPNEDLMESADREGAAGVLTCEPVSGQPLGLARAARNQHSSEGAWSPR